MAQAAQRTLIVAAGLAALFVCLVALAPTGPTRVQAAASACAKWGDQHPSRLTQSQARAAITCLLNRERKREGIRPLKLQKHLGKAALRHTRTMKRHACFDHRCPGEPDLEGRLRNVGYIKRGLRYLTYGENIIWGPGSSGSPANMVRVWMESPPHRDNILNRGFRHLGVGFAGGQIGSPGPGGIYTTDFGNRRG